MLPTAPSDWPSCSATVRAAVEAAQGPLDTGAGRGLQLGCLVVENVLEVARQGQQRRLDGGDGDQPRRPPFDGSIGSPLHRQAVRARCDVAIGPDRNGGHAGNRQEERNKDHQSLLSWKKPFSISAASLSRMPE